MQKKGSQRRISVCGLADQTAKWRKKQDGTNSLKKRIKKWWQELTIQKKIAVFTGMVCVTILLSVVFNVWVVRFSLTDFNGILQDNAKCSELIQALEQESTLFESYMRNPDTEKKEALERSMKRTKHAVYDLPFQYRRIGELRYAKTWSIRSSYEVYCTKRDAILSMEDNVTDYVSRLYEVYDMQDYLKDYAGTLMNYTIEEGDVSYQKKVPTLISVPLVVIFAGILLLFGIAEMAALMKETIMAPIFKLVHASQKIAANDFFIRDVEVDNKDELGELVRAFNKMKYATGEYIQALEEKRKTLDLLHEEELEKLETEKRLEMTKLELLKSQINPHFLMNALNSIHWMALTNHQKEIDDYVKHLGFILSYSLGKAEQNTTLRTELKYLQYYLELQQMTHDFSSEFDIAEGEYLNTRCARFLLQPIAENAVCHNMDEFGTLWVEASEQDGIITIRIRDDGKGFEISEKMEQNAKDERKGIGLRYVQMTLKSFYGEEAEMKIESELGKGTEVTLHFPVLPA